MLLPQDKGGKSTRLAVRTTALSCSAPQPVPIVNLSRPAQVSSQRFLGQNVGLVKATFKKGQALRSAEGLENRCLGFLYTLLLGIDGI